MISNPLLIRQWCMYAHDLLGQCHVLSRDPVSARASQPDAFYIFTYLL